MIIEDYSPIDFHFATRRAYRGRTLLEKSLAEKNVRRSLTPMRELHERVFTGLFHRGFQSIVGLACLVPDRHAPHSRNENDSGKSLAPWGEFLQCSLVF